MESSRTFVRSLARGLEVIVTLGDRPEGMTLSEVARAVGLDRASARRCLLTLQTLRYVCANGKRFLLAPRVLDLGYAYLSSMPVWEIAAPYMRDVADAAGENCSMGVLDGMEVVYLASAQSSRREMAVQASVGQRLPAYCTSMGRVLLAGLPPAELGKYLRELSLVQHTDYTIASVRKLRAVLDITRSQGWASSDREYDLLIRSVSVPIRNREHAVIAALNVSVHADRIPLDELVQKYLPMLQASAIEIEAALQRK